MIKRNGKEIINSVNIEKKKFKGVSGETLNILNEKKYKTVEGLEISLEKDIDEMVKDTTYYDELFNYDEVFTPNQIEKSEYQQIEITEETTTQAATRLGVDLKDIVVLNFASGTNPGGGWLNGARAQEESLMYRSALFSSLIVKPMYYNSNNKSNNSYTDGIIYSKNVPFFRDEYLLLKSPYYLSIITCPAPYVKYQQQDELKNIIDKRIIKIIKVAIINGHKNIILGAWGCGAFGNDPEMVAQSFFEALNKLPYFDNICFAIHDTSEDKNTLNVFKRIFNH